MSYSVIIIFRAALSSFKVCAINCFVPTTIGSTSQSKESGSAWDTYFTEGKGIYLSQIGCFIG